MILERLREAVDTRLHDNQAGFRKGRSCADQITTLRIIIEQSLEWKSPLYINFIDSEKAFYSVDQQVLRSLMKLYGIPDKFINLVKSQYEGMTFQVVHNGQLSSKLRDGYWSEARLSALPSPFPVGSGLDQERNKRGKKKQNTVDAMALVG